MKFQKYMTALRLGLQNSLEYRFDFFFGILNCLFPILIQVFLWYALYDGTDSGKSMYGYDFAQMMAYVAIAGVVSRFVGTGIENTVNNDIHSGNLATYLVKPIHYIRLRIFQTIGGKLPSIAMFTVFVIAVLVSLNTLLGFKIVAANMLFFVLALILATVLNFYLFFIISTVAFWLTEVGSLFGVLQVTIMVLSGGVFPISIFGDGYVWLMRFLPFQYTTYFPISVMTGAFDMTQIVTGLAVQLIWIGLLWLFSRFAWNIGIKRYVAVGG